MSDSEYSDQEDFSVERQPEPEPKKKESKKQSRTPAQKRALEQARLSRALKAQRRRESQNQPESSIYYLVATGLLSAGALGAYYYVKQQEKLRELQVPSNPEPVPVPRPVIQRVVQPISEIKSVIDQTIQDALKKYTPEPPAPVPEPEPPAVIEPPAEPEPVMDSRMAEFLQGARQI